MKCLILAAGYATRLYPLTENFPKPLLKVGDKTILDWLLEDIDTSRAVDQYAVISNHKFAPHFQAWAEANRLPVTVVDDGTSSNETRLGAVCDIQFAIDRLQLDDDLLIIAGDNLLDFSLTRFIRYAVEKDTSCVMRYYEADEKRLQKSGVAELGENDRLLSLEEKPAVPKSHWCTPPFYYYKKQDAACIQAAIADGCGTDAPGSLVAWMCRHTVVHSMEMPGNRYDIGNLESYEKAQSTYHGITR
ncbi:MAG: NTP transferase domain-containing protein [Clostridia bacterium]|nr:NTP transferase domain-containing protein [Clostridia bacterium]